MELVLYIFWLVFIKFLLKYNDYNLYIILSIQNFEIFLLKCYSILDNSTLKSNI